MNDRYDALTANDREMLASIFRDKQAVKEMNSTQLASFLHVSRTTLVRLIKKLEIDSYKEFKLLLNRKEEEHTAYLYDLQDIHHFTTYANRYIDAKAAVSVPL